MFVQDEVTDRQRWLADNHAHCVNVERTHDALVSGYARRRRAADKMRSDVLERVRVLFGR